MEDQILSLILGKIQCRPLDMLILVLVVYNAWRIRFIVQWIQGGCKHGSKKKEKESR